MSIFFAGSLSFLSFAVLAAAAAGEDVMIPRIWRGRTTELTSDRGVRHRICAAAMGGKPAVDARGVTVQSRVAALNCLMVLVWRRRRCPLGSPISLSFILALGNPICLAWSS